MQSEGDFRREKESFLEKLGGAFHQFGLGGKEFQTSTLKACTRMPPAQWL